MKNSSERTINRKESKQSRPTKKDTNNGSKSTGHINAETQQISRVILAIPATFLQ
jgi:hypothetical protein